MTPAEMFDEAFASAFRDRRDLVAFLERFDEAQARWRPPDGEWSIAEGLEHIVLTDDFFRERILALIGEAERTGRWDTMPERPVKMSPEALRRREQGPVAAPEALLPRGGGDIARMREGLLPAREAARRAFLPHRGTDLSRLRFAHPIYGDRNIYDAIVYSGIHDALHREQMERVARQPGFPRGRGG